MEKMRKKILEAGAAPSNGKSVIWGVDPESPWLAGWASISSEGYCGKHDQWWKGNCSGCWAQEIIDLAFRINQRWENLK